MRMNILSSVLLPELDDVPRLRSMLEITSSGVDDSGAIVGEFLLSMLLLRINYKQRNISRTST